MELDHKRKYLECKQRNETQLLKIRELESRISKIQQQIKNKKKTLSGIKEKESQYNRQLREHQRKYQKETENEETVLDHDFSEEPEYSIGKRDLLQMVPTTPEIILKKTMSLIEQQYNEQEPISSENTTQIKVLLDRLPKEQNEFWNGYIEQWIREAGKITVLEKDGIENKFYNFDQQQQRQKILRHYSKQIETIQELLKRKTQLELETREAEMNIVRRIKELHSDPNVQSALIKNVRVKAAHQQANVELQSTINQIEDMVKNIKEIQNNSNMDDMKSYMSYIVNELDKKQVAVQSLLSTNNELREVLIGKTLQQQGRQQVNYEDLLKRIEEAKAKKVVDQQKQQQNYVFADQLTYNDTLVDISNLISPYSLISTNRALSEISNIIDSVNTLSKEDASELCVEIKSKLEDLYGIWRLSLENQNISIPEDDIVENHDGIDKILQSVNALQTHIQNEEQNYLKKQNELIETKLNEADEIQEEIQRTRTSLKERELLKQIGSDYTLQSKNFNEWLQALQININKDT
ncbi:MAG: hypothetical protein EXX96DRAFT_548688 [Benjaminiella poitrasii]|nr:MAG: hypothetical protein EXX96DRAFT_548688 [Benjaminiella poitrasii]